METPDTLLAEWKDNESQTRRAFTELLDHIKSMTGIRLDFKARKGVSYSLRPGHRNQTNRELFAMVDVIDDDPDERWISVCFYGDMITDPDETGDLIPEGLLGDYTHQPDTKESTKQNYRPHNKVKGDRLQGNGFPNKNMKRHFKQVNYQKKPGYSSNKDILGKLHGKHIQAHNWSGSISYHRTEATCDSKKTS